MRLGLLETARYCIFNQPPNFNEVAHSLSQLHFIIPTFAFSQPVAFHFRIQEISLASCLPFSPVLAKKLVGLENEPPNYFVRARLP